MKLVLKIILGLVVLYGVLVAGVFAAMHRPPETFGRIMSRMPMPAFLVIPFRPMWLSARAGHLNPGDAAADFELPTLDRKSTVRLSSFRGQKPVVLVFGSYT